MLKSTAETLEKGMKYAQNMISKILCFFLSHGSTNSYGVAIGFCGLKSLYIIDKKSDENGRILKVQSCKLKEH